MPDPNAPLFRDLSADLLHIKAHTISALAWYHTALADPPNRQKSDRIEVELNVVLGWVESALNSLETVRTGGRSMLAGNGVRHTFIRDFHFDSPLSTPE